MPTFNDPHMMRQVIMDHYEFPRNKQLVEDNRYQKVHMDSESCIDDIYVQALIHQGKLEDIRFDGVACTISTASTSIMTELLKGKTLHEAQYIIDQYLAMIEEKPYDAEVLEEAVVFKNTSKQANRIKCATIGWNGIQQIIKTK